MHDMKQASSETVIQWGRTTWRMRHARCLRLIAGKAEWQRKGERENEQESQRNKHVLEVKWRLLQFH